MDESSRPATPEQNLWDSILNSVSTRRSIPSGNVLILGDPSTGKSTLGNALLQRSAEAKDARVVDAADGFTKNDFALGYQWSNVKEEGEEDIVARLSVYTVPSSDSSHLTLVPQFLPPRTALPRTLAVIVLDWTKPWTFVDQLRTWLSWIESWAGSDSSREAQVVREEGHDRLKSHLQHYVEPTSTSAPLEGLTAVTSSINSTLLPLGDGSLTHNVAGVPIVVVCTKADLIDEEENVGLGTVKGKGGEWEEKTDAVMQVLRTISLQYGAALFYTTPQPNTLSTLRQYVLHFLFTPPPPPPDSPPLKYPFPFSSTPNTLDRDRILVPAGWDSWGKIAVLRDGFDASRWSEAWERDLDAEGEQELPRGGARALFREIIGDDTSSKTVPLPAMVTTDPEQSFLQHHFELLSKDRDPRQQFRQPPPSSAGAAAGGAEDGYGSYAGVVGPMGGASSLSLPSVRAAMHANDDGEGGAGDVAGRILGRVGRNDTAGGSAPIRRDSRSTALSNGLSIPSLSVATSAGPSSASGTSRPGPPSSITSSRAAAAAALNLPTSPNSGISPGGGLGAGEAQREVLQSFFTTLLQSKTAGSPASPSSPLPAVRGINAGSRSRTTSQTTSGAGGNAPAGGNGES
ncbi:DLIC-domain-containing protein [Clavulina sp. PMI_390]|nr:DLIC-domain-containing protein [Clavulina sp. PMI_390]